jgi:hypothetical protein
MQFQFRADTVVEQCIKHIFTGFQYLFVTNIAFHELLKFDISFETILFIASKETIIKVFCIYDTVHWAFRCVADCTCCKTLVIRLGHRTAIVAFSEAPIKNHSLTIKALSASVDHRFASLDSHLSQMTSSFNIVKSTHNHVKLAEKVHIVLCFVDAM